VLCFFILGVITLNHSLRAEEFDLRGKFMPVQAAIMVNQAKQDSSGKPLNVWRLCLFWLVPFRYLFAWSKASVVPTSKGEL
jgi:hypothetical protein